MKTASIVRGVCWLAITAFFCTGSTTGCSDDTPPHTFRDAPQLDVNAAQLQSTTVSPHLHESIVAGQNVVWCASFQLAWNEARKLIHNDLRFAPPEDPAVAILNRTEVNDLDLDPDSYLAIAGRVGDGIFNKIGPAMAAKFHGAARPEMIPTDNGQHQPQDFVAYCYLFKNLNFPAPFEKLDRSLEFGGARVAAFGLGDGKFHPADMTANVSILDYKSQADFVIELLTRSKTDHLLLAKIAPGNTLADTLSATMNRQRNGKREVTDSADVLMIPKMNFKVKRSYDELTTSVLISDTHAAPQTRLCVADQMIHFLMDEKGFRLNPKQQRCRWDARPLPRQRRYM